MESDPVHILLARQPAIEKKSQSRGSFRFSLERLMVSMTILAVGIFIIAFPFASRNLGSDPIKSFVLCWVGGGTLIGAGISNLFGRPILGAIVGFAVQTGILSAFFLLYLMMGPVIG